MHASNDVIMPVLGMSQDSGKIIRWIVAEGQSVKRGEPLLEVETDKAVAEIEAPATGILSRVTAQAGEDVPVGKLIAVIVPADQAASSRTASPAMAQPSLPVKASPLAARIADDHQVDLGLVRPQAGGRVTKADVLAYLQTRTEAAAPQPARTLASPKARRLAAESGQDLAAIAGSGPEGAVLAADVAAHRAAHAAALSEAITPPPLVATPPPVPETSGVEITPSATWRIMAERTTAAWNQAPHFFLMREVDATRLMAWREVAQKDTGVKVTYTDLLVKLAAAALRKHPRINAIYQAG
jgi:pyruvate dehydrogenase E2 component (dihydrolipoamide acetyltransferase)